MDAMANQTLDASQKALRINLDARRYGTFAEIGAGQEVARWFFRVGGAARTVAKSISAYDMAVSDAIYGPNGPVRQPPQAQGHARIRVRPPSGTASGKARSNGGLFCLRQYRHDK